MNELFSLTESSLLRKGGYWREADETERRTRGGLGIRSTIAASQDSRPSLQTGGLRHLRRRRRRPMTGQRRTRDRPARRRRKLVVVGTTVDLRDGHIKLLSDAHIR